MRNPIINTTTLFILAICSLASADVYAKDLQSSADSLINKIEHYSFNEQKAAYHKFLEAYPDVDKNKAQDLLIARFEESASFSYLEFLAKKDVCSKQLNDTNRQYWLSYLLKSFDKAIENSDEQMEASLHSELAQFYIDRYFYTSSISHLNRAINLYHKYENYNAELSSRETLGRIFYELHSYDRAKQYLLKTCRFASKLDSSDLVLWHQMSMYNTLGLCLANLTQYDSALFYFDKSHEIATLLNNTHWQGLTIGNKGRVHIKLDNYDLAKQMTLFDLEAIGPNARIGIFCGYLNMANIYEREEKLDSARFYLQKYDSVYQLEPIHYYSDYYQILSKIYEREGNQTLALKYYKRYNEISDSITNHRTNSIIELGPGFVYDLETTKSSLKASKEQEKASEARQTIQQLLIGLLALGVILVGSLLTFYLHSNKKYKKLNQTLTEEKTKLNNAIVDLDLAKERLVKSEKLAALGQLTSKLSHEINNPLNYLKGAIYYLQDLSENTTKKGTDSSDIETVVKILEIGIQRIQDLTSKLSNLDDVSYKKSETIDPHELILQCVDKFTKEKNNTAKVVTELTDAKSQITVDSYRVSQAIMYILQNAQEATGYDGEIVIKTSAPKSKNEFIISISDNGSGIDESLIKKVFDPLFSTKHQDTHMGLGLTYAHNVIQESGAHINILSKNKQGTKVELIFKIEKNDD